MNFLRLFPVILSMGLLAAHFSRGGFDALAIVCLIIPFLLLIKKRWVAITFQIIMIVGALEWVGTTIHLAQGRVEQGMPWTRLAIILLSVALFTGLSALVFRSKALRARYAKKS